MQRKTNLFEPRVELKRLGPNSYFGELALINDEPRSATITVVSDHAKCLKMTKAKFDEIITVTKMFNAKRSTLSEIITEKIALFKPLSSVTRGRLLESMNNVSFSAGAYICRQVISSLSIAFTFRAILIFAILIVLPLP